MSFAVRRSVQGVANRANRLSRGDPPTGVKQWPDVAGSRQQDVVVVGGDAQARPSVFDRALQQKGADFPNVMFAGLTHATAIELARRLVMSVSDAVGGMHSMFSHMLPAQLFAVRPPADGPGVSDWALSFERLVSEHTLTSWPA